MSISPMNFNGMIQNTVEVKNARMSEDQKPALQQAAATLELSKREEAQSRQVNAHDDVRQQEQRYDREGDGRGYQKNSKKLLKKKSEKREDGRVIVKPTSTFDIKI